MSNTTRRPTVGDYVRVIKTDEYTDAAELKMGDAVKIRHDDKSDRPYCLHSNPGYPSDMYCFASSFELVTNHHPELEALKATHAKMAEEIKALETKITDEAKAKRPELNKGQLWEHRGTRYIVTPAPYSRDKWILVDLGSGNHWMEDRGFDGDDLQFTYLGMAYDLLTIKEPNK